MRWRKQTRKPTSPNFLFSLPPYIEEGEGVPTVILYPNEGGHFATDDTPRMQAAVNRLSAVGGGTMRLTAGEYFPGGSFYLEDSL